MTLAGVFIAYIAINSIAKLTRFKRVNNTQDFTRSANVLRNFATFGPATATQ